MTRAGVSVRSSRRRALGALLVLALAIGCAAGGAGLAGAADVENPLHCSAATDTRVVMTLIVEQERFNPPIPREILVVKKPLRDWEAQALLEKPPGSSKYRDALDCLLASPDDRRGLDEFGPTDLIPRPPAVIVGKGVVTAVFNNPRFTRLWNYQADGRRLILGLRAYAVPAAPAVTVVARFPDATADSLSPPPKSFDGRSARWRLSHKNAAAPWAKDPSASLITLKLRPAAEDSLALLRDQGVLRYLDQALWLLTRFAFVLVAFFLVLRMRRASREPRLRRPASQALAALLALLVLPGSIVVFSPGFRSRSWPDRDVQTWILLALLSVPLVVAWVLLRRRRLGSGRAGPWLFVIALAGSAVLLALPSISERASGAGGDASEAKSGAVGVARSLSVGLMPLAYVAAVYVALAGLLWLAVAVWPSARLWPARETQADAGSLPSLADDEAAADRVDDDDGLRLPNPRNLLAQAVLLSLAAFIVAHSLVETLRQIGPWDWPTWRLDRLVRDRDFFDLRFRTLDYPVSLTYQLIGLIPLIALVALLLVLRARSLVYDHPLFVSRLEPAAAAIVFAGLVGSSFGNVLGFPAPTGFLLAALLVRYGAISGLIDKIANGVREGDPGDTLLQHRTELLERAAAIERNEHDLSLLDEKRDKGEIALDEYPREHARLVSEIQRLSTNGAAGGGAGLALPPGVDPDQVALALGPRGTPWGNATVALRQGVVLAVLPVAYYVYVLITHQHILGFDSDFGPLRMLAAVASEVGFWLAASFVLGFLFVCLHGRNGALKGLTLGAVYAVAVAVGSALDSGYFAFNVGGNVFRVGELILFLALLGAGLDLETVREGGERRTTKALFEHYKLHDVRRVASYASPLILAAIAVGQQLLTGHAGNAVLELIKNLPQVTGH